MCFPNLSLIAFSLGINMLFSLFETTSIYKFKLQWNSRNSKSRLAQNSLANRRKANSTVYAVMSFTGHTHTNNNCVLTYLNDFRSADARKRSALFEENYT